ncbi:MAG: JAB domain-containing protein [Polyangiaceae bacterium]
MTTTEATRPRERAVEDGLDALSDAELVALVLGTGRVGEPIAVFAAALLEESGGVAGLARAGLGELAARRGVGPAKAARLAAAIELGRRVAATVARQTDARFPSSSAVDGWARPRLAALDHEELWALILDGHQGLRAARRVASGGLHGLHIGARDPLRFVLRDGGSAFVLVHNHPSGDPAPSPEDVRFTEEVARAADIVGVPLLDHVIVARGGYASLLDAGVLRSPHPSVKRAKLRSA